MLFIPQTKIRRNFLQKQGKKKKKKKNRPKKKKNPEENYDNETQDAQQNGGNETLQKNDVECDFQAYWLEHGEFLVWQAWLEKYSDYVNTDMMDHVAMPVETEVEICATEDGDGTMGQVMEDSGTGRIDRKQTTQLEFSEFITIISLTK